MDQAVKSLEAADIQEILKALPHRYPFLMVDRIVQMRGDEFAIGIKNVTANEPQFMGHFPDNPIFPGVLMIEGMAQTAGVLCITSGATGGKTQSVYFLTIDKAKFRKQVRPGDTIEYHMTKKARKKMMWWFHGRGQGWRRNRCRSRGRGHDREWVRTDDCDRLHRARHAGRGDRKRGLDRPVLRGRPECPDR